MIMRHKGCMLMVVFALFLGFVAPVWAGHTSDPLEESYSQHVLPYYNINQSSAAGPVYLSFLVFADTSFNDFSSGGDPIHVYFFDSTCVLRRDASVTLTTNGIAILGLNAPALALPTEGVAFADSGNCVGGTGCFGTPSPAKRFLTYVILVSLTDNTMT